jgi:HNH endonuclease
MSTDQFFTDVSAFAVTLRELHAQRRGRVISGRSKRAHRAVLKKTDRDKVLGKTGGRCHICGGTINADDWQADHILAHSTGGAHLVENYLPAHSICNNYRWHYDAEEFQWILKLGVWLRTQIEKETLIGQEVGHKFCEHERRRAGRRKLATSDLTASDGM